MGTRVFSLMFFLTYTMLLGDLANATNSTHIDPDRQDPWNNCTICHGDDLLGGFTGVACIDCHNDFSFPDPPPTGHHFSGRDDPYNNCTSCHGDDLMGGVGPSCFWCHGQLWPAYNQPPWADPNGPYTGIIGQSVQFDGSGSFDPDGTIISYDWDFGDGNTGIGETPTHTYAAAGTYTATLTVTDNEGATDTASTTVFISPSEIEGFCKGNFDYDQDVDGGDAYTFKLHFGRSAFKNPCPPDGPAPVAKTGQTTPYIDTDDGDLQKGISWPTPRFTDNENGTITDNLTGLIWLRDANCSLFNAPRSWNDGLNIIVPQLANGYCGLTDGSITGDWRLPNRKELETLLDFEHSNPALPSGHPFINVQSRYYWSSTTFVDNTSNAWIVWMGNGLVNNGGNKLDSYYVWPVRGGH